MHPALQALLREALPSMYGANVRVEDEALEGNDGGERFMKAVRRQLGELLGRLITDEKILNGADQSCFEMKPSTEFEATDCTAKVHVLTPMELESLMKRVFEAGQRNATVPEVVPAAQSTWGGDPYSMPTLPDEAYRPNPAWAKPWEIPKPMSKELRKSIEEAYYKRHGKYP